MPTRSPAVERLVRAAPLLVAGVVLVLLWAIVVGFVTVQQRRLLAASERSLHLINQALTEQTAGLLDNATASLRAIDEWVRAHPGEDPLRDAALAQWAGSLGEGRGDLLTLRIASRSGTLLDWPGAPSSPRRALHSRLPPPPPLGQTRFGEPLRLENGGWVLPLVRALHAPGGQASSAVALIDLDQLMALHDSMRMQPAGSIALISSEGIVLSRVPPLPGMIGRNLGQQAPEILPRLAQAQASMVYDGALTDRVRRLVNLGKVHEYPVTLIVTQGVDQALATYYERRPILIAVCAAFTVLALVALAWLARVQRQHRTRQAELAAVSNDSPLGMFRSTPDGRLSYVNAAYLRIHGLARADAAEGWLGLLAPQLRQRARDEWAAISAGAAPFHCVRRLCRADGVELLVEIDSAPVWVDGRVVGHVGTVKDITEQANGQRALHTLTAIFDATTDFVAQTDARGRMLYMNPAARRLAGIGEHDPIGHLSFTDLNPPQTVERYAREIVPQALEHGVWVGEAVKRDAHGREIPCSHVLIAHRDKNGKLEYFSAIMRDVSADKAAQHAVLRSEATLRAVAEALPAMVAVVDRQQRYVFANSAFERGHDATRDAIVGREMVELLGEAEYAQRQPWIERALAGEVVGFDSERPGRHLHISYTPLRLADGSTDGFIVIANDITEQRTEEARLREMARIDPLTGVLNRAGLEHAFDRRSRRRGGELCALLYIDLDRFKEINDLHGHAVGDQLLAIFCQRMRALVRPADAIARVGGDEFA
ncbi:MAG TPA: PAS domain S-box protein, partial [Albitalea sp.]|nr:PAS domain S-box protein [Albitalea sp.]